MELAGLAVIVFSLMFCEISGSSLKAILTRKKRWEDQANMNVFRGTAGVDYPDFKQIPLTNFRCEDQIYEGGLYADVETQCQVYHVCHDGRKDSFLCGRGTVFNQQILACDYWYSTDCNSAPNFYYMNSQIGKSGGPQASQHGYPQNGNNQYSQNGNSGYPQYNTNGQSQPSSTGYAYNEGSNQPNQPASYGNTYESHPQTNNRNAFAQMSGNTDHSNLPYDKQSCRCLQSNYKAPWSFPSS